MAFFWVVAVIGVGLLLIAAMYLVVVNWSEEMYPRLVSAVGIGVITREQALAKRSARPSLR